MIGAEVAARYTAKVGTVLSPLPLNQTFAGGQDEMDNIASVIAWGVSLIIGVPMVLIGAFYLLFPRAAWSVYRGWGTLWGSDPAEIAPAYKSGAAMRVVGLALVLGGGTICCIPKLMGH